MALVELRIPPLPAHVRTARLVVVAAARRAGLDDDLVDELRLALGEACSRAVGLHARHAVGKQVSVTISDDVTGLVVAVTDHGPAVDAEPALRTSVADSLTGQGGDDGEVDSDVALAVVAGLVDDMDVDSTPGRTTVTMRWPLQGRGPGATAVARA